MKDPGRNEQFFLQKLQEAGIRLTHQRLEIVHETVFASGHPSVSDIYEAVRLRMPTVSLDTVYRTMKKLAELGLIHPVGYSADGVRFDADRTPHHHFLCAFCGEAYDFRSSELDIVPVPEQAKKIGTVRGSRMEVRGICRNCQKEE